MLNLMLKTSYYPNTSSFFHSHTKRTSCTCTLFTLPILTLIALNALHTPSALTLIIALHALHKLPSFTLIALHVIHGFLHSHVYCMFRAINTQKQPALHFSLPICKSILVEKNLLHSLKAPNLTLELHKFPRNQTNCMKLRKSNLVLLEKNSRVV